MNKFIIILSLLIFINAENAIAQKSGDSQQPVEISADNSLEWLQNKKQYIANGNVEASQGDVTIFTEKLIADYKDGDSKPNESDTQIWQLTAAENVRIVNLDTTATGDKGVYNIETGLVTLTGKNLKLTTPDQTITAKKRMEYNTKEGVAKAIGNAVITEERNKLRAPIITAFFEKNRTGKESLKTAKAEGGVTITTPEETLTGNTATYNAKTNKAIITGNVKIVRGKNILEGARGEVNLNNNVSKMFGENQTGERVRAVFFPGATDKD